MITKTDILKKWANAWINLTTWGRPLTEASFAFKPYEKGRLGCAWTIRREIEIRETGKLACDLATVLHELAHLAVPGADRHSDRWRVAFCRGAQEATGIAISDTGSIHMLDRQAESACQAWLVRSGQIAFLRALNIA